MRELLTVEQTLAQVSGARYFSKLDANSGFWQIPLAKESSLLTMFITPAGRYRFNRLPFGIASAPEQFQSRMTNLLNGMEGVVCLMDDVRKTQTTRCTKDPGAVRNDSKQSQVSPFRQRNQL